MRARRPLRLASEVVTSVGANPQLIGTWNEAPGKARLLPPLLAWRGLLSPPCSWPRKLSPDFLIRGSFVIRHSPFVIPPTHRDTYRYLNRPSGATSPLTRKSSTSPGC